MRFPSWGVIPVLTMSLVTTTWGSALGQNPPVSLPPPSQAQAALEQALQQNPSLASQIRNRLLSSGMTPDQVRARLQASGYPPNLLDAYIGGDTLAAGQPRISVDQVAAIQAIGLQPIAVSLTSLPVDTGFVRALRGTRPESTSLVFGVDAFKRTTTQFLPLLSGPVPPDYKLGPGDQLVLILTGDVELSYTLPVTREGFVLIPQVGQVFVSSLTLEQLQGVLLTRLGRVYSGVRRTNPTTHFDVSVANVRANQVYVTGEVIQPGAYQISSLGTVLTALYAAGGITDRSDMRHVMVRRAGVSVDTLDLYDYLLRGDTRRDVRLETGDVVFVPAHGWRAHITGAVSRPAIYAVKTGETLLDLVRAAGGFRPDASLKRVTIFRYLPAAERAQPSVARGTVDVALAPAGAGDASVGDVAIPAVALADGDSVVVDSLPVTGQYTVGIAGMVNRVGRYPWHEGMTLRDLMLLARGPRVGAALKDAEIARLPTDRSAGQLATTIRVPLDSTYLIDRDSLGHYIGPPGLPYPPRGAPEVQLQPYDNVLVLRQPDFDFQRTVAVTGEVRYPGVYSLRNKKDRLSDVVGRAGGLTSQAYPEGIRFFRAQNDVGRVNVDLGQALRDTAGPADLVLQPGDSIHIPEYQPSVKVSGAVNSPGSVLWRAGADLSYYLSAAGGFAQRADKGAVSVRFANGEVRSKGHGLFRGDPKPGPGSEVFVPSEDPTAHKTDTVALFGAIAQILASAVTIAVVVTKL